MARVDEAELWNDVSDRGHDKNFSRRSSIHVGACRIGCNVRHLQKLAPKRAWKFRAAWIRILKLLDLE